MFVLYYCHSTIKNFDFYASRARVQILQNGLFLKSKQSPNILFKADYGHASWLCSFGSHHHLVGLSSLAYRTPVLHHHKGRVVTGRLVAINLQVFSSPGEVSPSMWYIQIVNIYLTLSKHARLHNNIWTLEKILVWLNNRVLIRGHITAYKPFFSP